jgi:hypothetical protein
MNPDMASTKAEVKVSCGSKSGKQKNVRFDLRQHCYIIPNDRTPEEIENCWWTRSELRATLQVCQHIARESRKLCNMAECVDALYRLTTSKMFRSNPDLDAYLLETVVAKRLVQYSRNGVMLRGLEYRVCEKLVQHSMKSRARLCRIQRLPDIKDENLCQISQNYSRFDRIMAQLLGQADALWQLEQSEKDVALQRRHVQTLTIALACDSGSSLRDGERN